METEAKTCPICRTSEDGRTRKEVGPHIYELQCRYCGVFQLDDDEWNARLNDIDRQKLTWFTRTRMERGQTAPLLWLNWGGAHRGEGAFSLDDVRDRAPREIAQVHDEFLLTMAHKAKTQGGVHFGTIMELDGYAGPLLFDDIEYHVELLKEEALVEDAGSSQDIARLQLTSRGWQHVETLERSDVAKPRQVFVAMFFDDTLETAYEQGLARAVRDSGYEPLRVDLLEHNNKICDQIIAEVRKSRFLVADFTGGRGGVYYEAGFAHGLGKPVIFTCNREWYESKGIHFDTRQYNHIFWASPEELYVDLRARIEATMPPA